MSGIFFDGHIFIFASFQFGQKTADSPLGSAIELYFVQLSSPVHVAAWVDDLTLAELHVLVLTSFIKLIKLLQKLMKLLGLIEVYYKLISDIIVNDCTTKKILKSQYIFKNFILFYI